MGNSTNLRVPFSQLDLGARFDFDREGTPERLISGPFVKISPRKYIREDIPQEMRIGTTSTVVIKLPAE